ncbi:hypothetical protein L1049_019977 [Liquidambar formosana]|uniref:F-box domain-containing protein n=1 Tax=Liquidambar formosana TaxID=63359 RepID=A0AAP0SDB7_LIQFO
MAETGESKKLTYLEVLVDGQKKHGCDSKESAVESRPWPNLPLDILRLILERCSLVEQIRLYAVCKSWHDHAPSVDRLPWLMTYDWSEKLGNYLKSNCNFSGPARDQTCNLDQIIYGEGTSDFIGADTLALKKGWLLLKNGDRPFLYNPFRRQIMNLPSLDVGSDHQDRPVVRSTGLVFAVDYNRRVKLSYITLSMVMVIPRDLDNGVR